MSAQRKLGTVGSTVREVDELEQSLRLLLTVPKGSIPHRPDLGSELHELIDAPVDTVRACALSLVVRATVPDTRLRIVSVVPTALSSGAVELEVVWSPSGTTNTRATKVTVG